MFSHLPCILKNQNLANSFKNSIVKFCHVQLIFQILACNFNLSWWAGPWEVFRPGKQWWQSVKQDFRDSFLVYTRILTKQFNYMEYGIRINPFASRYHQSAHCILCTLPSLKNFTTIKKHIANKEFYFSTTM